MLKQINKKEISIMTCELAQYYLGCKLIEENQEFDFSWRSYPHKSSTIISMIVGLKFFNSNPELNIKEVVGHSYDACFKFQKDKLDDYFLQSGANTLPLNSYDLQSSYIQFFYSITILSRLISFLEYYVNNEIKIPDESINILFTYFCYKETTALENINALNYSSDKYKFPYNKNLINISQSHMIDYANYLLNSNNYYIQELTSLGFINEKKVADFIKEYCDKTFK